jgi:hypothetical protein
MLRPPARHRLGVATEPDLIPPSTEITEATTRFLRHLWPLQEAY